MTDYGVGNIDLCNILYTPLQFCNCAVDLIIVRKYFWLNSRRDRSGLSRGHFSSQYFVGLNILVDVRAAVKALIVANQFLETDLEKLKAAFLHELAGS